MKLCFDHCYNFLLVDVSIKQVIIIKKIDNFFENPKIELSPIQNGRELLQLIIVFTFFLFVIIHELYVEIKLYTVIPCETMLHC